MINTTDVAWCAGVFDALGAIRMRTMDTGAVLPAVHVSTANLDVLEHIAHLTGVGVTRVTRDYQRLGCGEHCTEAHQHVLSVTGRWSLVGARAYVFLCAIEPYVAHKDVTEGIAAGAAAPFKPATVAKMLALGWPDPTEES